MHGITDLKSCIEFVKHNRDLPRVKVSKRAFAKIRHEIRDSCVMKESRRPKKTGIPFLDVEIQLWEHHRFLMKIAPVFVMGVQIVSGDQ